MREDSIQRGIVIVISVVVVFVLFSPLSSLLSLFGRSGGQAAATPPPNEKRMPGFLMQDIIVGKGKEAKNGSVARVHYTSSFTDGRMYETTMNGGEPISIKLGAGQVVRGLDIGIVGMREGGKRVLVVPPEYLRREGSDNPPAGVPADAYLLFEVNLIEVADGGR